MVVYGTRPEAIKMAPVVGALERSEHLSPVVVLTGQHRTMLDQVNSLFGIEAAHDLDIISPRQTLEDITTRTLVGLRPLLEQEQPDAVLVQGDTTTCFAAALGAFYHQVPVFHLEAGLRTDNRYNPFPEEVNRRLTTQLAALHLAPTSTSRENLLRDGVDPAAVVTTGNTVIDALLDVVGRGAEFTRADLTDLRGRRVVLITAHRRESWGEPMRQSGRAIARLADAFPDVVFVLPAHLNPTVREVLLPIVGDRDNVLVTEPLDYADFASLMSISEVVLTDSGGVQEEAPSLGKPVLVMRETTERPEAVTAGTVRLVGTDEERIVAEVTSLLTDPAAYGAMAQAVNPYGDGRAAVRCVQAMESFFGCAARPDEFVADR
ncbi:UDP-N-acetylglucosamine 2-epimerase (non-hydrolyzing) [Pedococcus bigeumensis]|uniref:UDP-N-acetylglucosamine 2-epimerase (non-hydrolyzing) n=2 Tax=Pedococcus bigeumensis TaxID=433644 RepID=A0A502D1Y8_9MICO|nr:UDP-N-acetylglucosamine 2-epimerase (non-hydrolyzing) [Pedococcus bigeumensis]